MLIHLQRARTGGGLRRIVGASGCAEKIGNVRPTNARNRMHVKKTASYLLNSFCSYLGKSVRSSSHFSVYFYKVAAHRRRGPLKVDCRSLSRSLFELVIFVFNNIFFDQFERVFLEEFKFAALLTYFVFNLHTLAVRELYRLDFYKHLP